MSNSSNDTLLHAAIKGLSQPQKTLPCKYLYDAKGAELFEQICTLPEYYPTRTELSIMQTHAAEMAACIGSDAWIIEYGSGEGLKTELLLQAFVQQHLAPKTYTPIDISHQQLLRVTDQLQQHFPSIEIVPICADYTQDFALPQPAHDNTAIFFPGSTIGNFAPSEAQAFLAQMAGHANQLLIGVDLKKSVDRLEQAYNDSAGITAAFNLNVLARLNHECQANFELDNFNHQAHFNSGTGAIEMHLVSQTAQQVHLNGDHFEFEAGETIHTENSYKYTLDEFAELASAAGWQRQQVWLDSEGLFSVQYYQR